MCIQQYTQNFYVSQCLIVILMRRLRFGHNKINLKKRPRKKKEQKKDQVEKDQVEKNQGQENKIQMKKKMINKKKKKKKKMRKTHNHLHVKHHLLQ